MMNSMTMKRVTLKKFVDEDDSFGDDDSYDEYEDEF